MLEYHSAEKKGAIDVSDNLAESRDLQEVKKVSLNGLIPYDSTYVV